MTSWPEKLPLLPVRDVVVFPHTLHPLDLSRSKSLLALDAAMANGQQLLLVTQRQSETEDPTAEDLYPIGVVARVLEVLRGAPGAPVKVLVEGLGRARWTQLQEGSNNTLSASIEPWDESTDLMESEPADQALLRQTLQLFEQYVKLKRHVSPDIVLALRQTTQADRLADAVASNLHFQFNQTAEKQALLEIVDTRERLSRLVQILSAEIEILNLERRIETRTRNQIERTQKEYYLNEKIKAIQKELKHKDEGSREIEDLREKIKAGQLPAAAAEAAEKEIARLEKMMPFSPEATVVRTYLDWLLNLPWSTRTRDTLDLTRAETTLDEDHFGLQKPKERILEYLAVLKLVKQIKGPVLCFLGPPGVGKTSLARSIARALGRQFVKISLGGVRDESEIRGHRRTYIGSLPGRILQSLRKAKTRNPVLLLDEVDKMGTDWRGDPAAALLEVLDPEQNRHFLDHFLDVEFDLSDVFFICTANSMATVSPTLQDRLEILRFSGYTEAEKLQIALKYLIPKQLKEHGLKPAQIKIDTDTVQEIIRQYTREAGVRALERHIASLCRKAARTRVASARSGLHHITVETARTMLGVPPFSRDAASENKIGVSTGLAWTEHGGEILAIEVAQMPGKGKLLLTGKLGEVMQESAQAALSFIRSHAKKWRIKNSSFKTQDYHIHVPEGATPKDGPSAGTAIATALVSAMTQRPVRKNIAMTGEITLQGRVLPIGGLKEKSLAAFREGVDVVLYPEGNRKDLEDIPDDIRKRLKLVPVKHMEQVISLALQS